MARSKLFKMVVSLKGKMLIAMVLALLIAAGIFVGVREIGDFLVWRYYLNEESKQERAEGYVNDFQEYVFENKMSINDSEKISDWSAGRYVDIVLYKDSNLIYAPDWFEDFESDSEAVNGANTEGEQNTESEGEYSSDLEEDAEEKIEDETEDVNVGGKTEDGIHDYEDIGDGWFSGDRGFEEYLNEEARIKYQDALSTLLDENRALSPIYFVDGTLLITIVDYTEDFLHNLVFAVSIIFALLVMTAIMLVVFSATVSRVKRLAGRVKGVESGSLDLPIVIDGSDEIADLANDVNSMRNTIVDKMSEEQRAWEANAGLITAMSHDIRTPLTVMLGYLDLMEMNNKNEEEAEYIAACKENALRLKTLSDDMFSYFLVFGQKEIELKAIEAQSSSALEHMVSEREMLLSENGHEVKREGDMPVVTVVADIVLLGRVVDNIFSNLGKYADPAFPILISTECSGDMLRMRFENRIKLDDSHAESNHIGIKTCERIMKKMGGGFCAETRGESFVTILSIPILKE